MNEITTPSKSLTPTPKEAIERLECLFKAYQKDSEFNYQLTIPNSPFNVIKKYIEQSEV